MSGVGGGLYDRDPEPDRNRFQTVSESTAKAARREWLFWFAMAVGLWSALQVNPLVVFLFLLVIVGTLAFRWLGGEIHRQIQESKEKGFWR